MADIDPSSLDFEDDREGAMAKVAWLLKDSLEYEQGLAAALKTELDNVRAGKKPTLSVQDRNDIVEEINNESEKRESYYTLITTNRSAQEENESVALATAQQQIETYKYLEANLDAVKIALNAAAEDRQKKMKMVEINTYYGKQYKGYGRIARVIAVVAGLLVILYFLRSNVAGYDSIISPLETIVQWVGGMYFVWTVYDAVSRRNDNYDEYVFPMAPRKDTDLENANRAMKSPILDISGIDIPGLCAGSYCCGPGTKWNDNKGCVANTNVVGNPTPAKLTTPSSGSSSTPSGSSSTPSGSSSTPSGSSSTPSGSSSTPSGSSSTPGGLAAGSSNVSTVKAKLTNFTSNLTGYNDSDY